MQKGVDGVAAAVMGDADAAAKVIEVYFVDQINHIGLEQERCAPTSSAHPSGVPLRHHSLALALIFSAIVNVHAHSQLSMRVRASLKPCSVHASPRVWVYTTSMSPDVWNLCLDICSLCTRALCVHVVVSACQLQSTWGAPLVHTD